MERKRLLFVGDGVVPTGFARVLHNIIGNLPMAKYEVHHIAINYDGNPHSFNWYVYPAYPGGKSFSPSRDVYGMSRLSEFMTNKWDGIFLLNDPVVIHGYLDTIKKNLPKGWNTPPIIVYFPVDSTDLNVRWFQNFDIVDKVVVYTEFAKKEVNKVREDLEVEVIPHGYDPEVFYKLGDDKNEVKTKYMNEEMIDSFIVFNGNRNQPRKRVDLTFQAFQIFAKDKPDNVKLYLHMGSKDTGYDILDLSLREIEIGGVEYPRIDNRLMMTQSNGKIPKNIQAVSDEQLNIVYNLADVGVNTAIGEGWGLCNFEQATLGIPQIVPNHSALTELYEDTGILIPVDRWERNRDTLTISGVINPLDLAHQLETCYQDRKLLARVAKKTEKKFRNPKYYWSTIVHEQWLPLIEETFG